MQISSNLAIFAEKKWQMEDHIEMREQFKSDMHTDLGKIKGLEQGIYIVTLQQEVIAYSLSQCLKYWEKTHDLPKDVCESIFKEASIAMREMYPGLYSLGEMGAKKPIYDDIVKDIDEIRTVVEDYYQKLNAVEQPSVKGGTIINYMSSRHIRIENISSANPNQWPIMYVPRHIKLHYTNLGKTLTVEIIPSMTAKRATLVKDENDVLTYIGDDPDFGFEIETKANNTIRRFSMFRFDKDMELRYLE